MNEAEVTASERPTSKRPPKKSSQAKSACDSQGTPGIGQPDGVDFRIPKPDPSLLA